MAQLIWSEPALQDLERIADYIALDKPAAAKNLVQKVFERVEKLVDFPEMGSIPREIHKTRYRQLVIPPLRVFYRYDRQHVYVIHVMRSEKRLNRSFFDEERPLD